MKKNLEIILKVLDNLKELLFLSEVIKIGKIKILDELVSNMIAAGEVVENPASMIKELLENALDAESKNIQISIKDGGRYVKISDDGHGMNKEDLLLAIERHATSKISTKDDLYNLITYGFRGEALSSISAVSKINMSSRTKDDQVGNYITVSGGKVTGIGQLQRNIGTTIEVKELFFNTPARLKFLRKTSTEYSNIKDIIIQEALCNPNIAITLVLDDKVSIKTSGNGIENTIVEIFGSKVLKNLKSFDLGFLGNGQLFKSTKDSIFTFVNNRMIKSKILEDAIIDAYYTKLMKGRYPFAILFLEIDPKEVDVNVHPSKKIVKFSNEDEIYNFVLQKVQDSFLRDDDFVSPTLEEKIEQEEEKEKRFLDFSDFEEFIPMKAQKQSFVELEEFKSENTKNKENFKNTIDKNKKFSYNKHIKEKIEESSFYEIKEPEKTTNLKVKDIEKNIEEIKENKNDNLDEAKDFINKKEIEKKNIDDFRVIGQLFKTFILVERNGIFEIYDQHIVHERILYEQLKEIHSGNKVAMQQLLVPISILVDPREMEIIAENKEEIEKVGFEIDRFSDNEILIRQVPIIKFNDSIENIFKNLIKDLKENKNLDIMENILVSLSCKSAVKANEKLTQEEMEIMVRKLHEIGEYTCPHGRPIIVKITLNDLEKLFKRK